jgi:hypothetical protein
LTSRVADIGGYLRAVALPSLAFPPLTLVTTETGTDVTSTSTVTTTVTATEAFTTTVTTTSTIEDV